MLLKMEASLLLKQEQTVEVQKETADETSVIELITVTTIS